MFELLFGLAFMGIPLIMGFFMYSGTFDGNITVNGVPVTQEEFNGMLMPKMLLGIFIVIGLVFFIIGLRKVIKNAKTSMLGVETYGIIVSESPSNVSVNGVPVMNGQVAVVMGNGQVRMFTESLGTGYKHGCVGDCVRIKQLDDDINIIAVTLFEEMPYDMQERLRAYHEQTAIPQHGTATQINMNEDIGEYVIINGVKYKKQD